MDTLRELLKKIEEEKEAAVKDNEAVREELEKSRSNERNRDVEEVIEEGVEEMKRVANEQAAELASLKQSLEKANQEKMEVEGVLKEKEDLQHEMDTASEAAETLRKKTASMENKIKELEKEKED